MKQFPWAYAILSCVPSSFLSILHPLTKRLFSIRSEIHAKIEQTKAKLETAVVEGAPSKKEPDTSHPTVIDALLATSSLPTMEQLTPRLEDEAFTLLGAGTITTAHTMTTIVYHVLANPGIKSQLELELSKQCSNLPTSQRQPDLRQLEQLPYLSAVVSEGLRLSFGVSHRLPRIAPDTALHYQGTVNGKNYDYTIPPGVPVSMTQMLIHLDPTIYPSPYDFEPRRWLASESNTDDAKDELRRRKQYLVPFSKGTRMCAGMHLAYAELYLVIGSLFLPGGVGTRMELFRTGIEDVECAHDFFNPSPRLDSKGMRVILKGELAE
jgi:cytochrome P450